MKKLKADENVNIYGSSPSIEGKFVSNLVRRVTGILQLRNSTIL